MLVFDDPRVGHVVRSIVDHGIALVVGGILYACFKRDRAPVEPSQAIIVELVQLAREDNLFRHAFPIGPVVEEIGVQAGLDAFQQAFCQLVVAAYGNALVFVVEIIVVEDHTDGKPLDDERRQVATLAAPLLFGVFLDERLVDITAHQRQSLLFEIGRFTALERGHRLGFLRLQFGLRSGRVGDTPHLAEGVHVEGQVVEASLVVGQGRIGVAVEGHQRIDEVPHPLVGGMEDMGTVLVHIDARHLLAIDIATQVGAFVYDQATPAGLAGPVGKSGAIQSGTDDEVIPLLHILRWIFLG